MVQPELKPNKVCQIGLVAVLPSSTTEVFDWQSVYEVW